jgi:hypothetical protein
MERRQQQLREAAPGNNIAEMAAGGWWRWWGGGAGGGGCNSLPIHVCLGGTAGSCWCFGCVVGGTRCRWLTHLIRSPMPAPNAQNHMVGVTQHR